MNRFLFYRVGLALAIATPLAGCVDDTRPQETSAAKEDFTGQLLEVARTYESYGRLDTKARWGTPLCIAIGRGPFTISPVFSESKHSDTHGQKLYSLFVKEASAYGDTILKDKPSPIGQVVVKESWIPEEVTDERKSFEPISRKVIIHGEEKTDVFLPYAGKDGRLYEAKRRGSLFIMLKVGSQTPGTDEGWVYGTVTADGKTVTSAGRVASCMKCHQEAEHDRLFGLKKQ